MITSSGNQNDKVVETSIVHLMQMYMFVIEVLQKSTFGAALGICKFFFEGNNCPVVGQGKCSKCDIDNATLWSKPIKLR